MSDTAVLTGTTSDMLNGSAAPAPAPSWQPIAIPQDPMGARSRIETLKSDKAFYDALMKKDAVATAEWSELHRAAYPPQNIGSIEDVAGQAAQREIQMREATLSTLAHLGGLNPTQVQEIRERRPCTQLEHDWAVAEKARMLKDVAFGQRVKQGDREANNAWIKVVQLAELPVRR